MVKNHLKLIILPVVLGVKPSVFHYGMNTG